MCVCYLGCRSFLYGPVTLVWLGVRNLYRSLLWKVGLWRIVFNNVYLGRLDSIKKKSVLFQLTKRTVNARSSCPFVTFSLFLLLLLMLLLLLLRDYILLFISFFYQFHVAVNQHSHHHHHHHHHRPPPPPRHHHQYLKGLIRTGILAYEILKCVSVNNKKWMNRECEIRK